MESFRNISSWLEQVEGQLPQLEHLTHTTGGARCVLVGNKYDLGETRVVTTDMGHNLADSLNIDFWETSARYTY